MTEDTIALRALLEKGSDATFLREMIGFAAQRLMELETEGLCGAGPGERSPQRLNQRNGYRDRNTGRAPSSSASRSCAKAATSRPFSSRAAWPRRH
jgi:transposase-like protein